MADRKKFHGYDAFVDKFVPKKTTDDCYTPQPNASSYPSGSGALSNLSTPSSHETKRRQD